VARPTGLLSLANTANRRRLGTTSRKSSTRLLTASTLWIDKPVTLPPGRARLATSPLPTGSPLATNTIGMTNVARLAAIVGRVEPVTMTLTLSRTNSSANALKRSGCPSTQRYSISTVRPSIQPSSCRRRTNTGVHWLSLEAEAALRYPMIGGFADCCARVLSGHTAAVPPRSVMKSRRLTRSPCRRVPPMSRAP
jgi:hypothetical protein